MAGMLKIIFMSKGLLDPIKTTTVICGDVKLTATVCSRGGIVHRIKFLEIEIEDDETPSDSKADPESV
ncbi:MAG: hypothetical protein ACI4SY_00025 [Sutterella sp.]